MPRLDVIYGDAELLAVDWLRAELPTYGGLALVGTRKPSPMPAGGVITVQAVGGHDETGVSRVVRLDVLVWHDDEKAAHDLAEIASALMRLARGVHSEGTVYRVDEFAVPYRNYDPESGQARYRFTVEAALRGHTLLPAGS